MNNLLSPPLSFAGGGGGITPEAASQPCLPHTKYLQHRCLDILTTIISGLTVPQALGQQRVIHCAVGYSEPQPRSVASEHSFFSASWRASSLQARSLWWEEDGGGGSGGRGMRGLDGYAGSEPGPHTKEREGLRLCLFLTLCLVGDRSTEHRWKVKRGQSVQEMDAAAAAGSALTCNEVFCSEV